MLFADRLIFRFILFLTFISIGINGFLLSSSTPLPLNHQSEPAGNYQDPYYDQDLDHLLSSRTGRIPILMYHNILTPRNAARFGKLSPRMQRYFVSSQEFRNQLETLHSLNFRNISLDEYLSLMKGQKKQLDRLPPGAIPYVLTFDDATYGQFDYIGRDSDGRWMVDPDCAVGIMLDFARQHPEFQLNAAFSVDFVNPPFLVAHQAGEKLNQLLDWGFELVNHTASHQYLSPLLEQGQPPIMEELGRAMEQFESHLGYRAKTVDKICYPGGRETPAVHRLVPEIHYNGKKYRFIAALDAEGLQAENPNSTLFNPYDISRIEVNRRNFDVYVLDALDLYRTPGLSPGTDLSSLNSASQQVLVEK